MSWWDTIAKFVGIPIGAALTITLLVYWLTEPRVPDGIAAANAAREAQEAAPGDEAQPTDDSDSSGPKR